MGQNRNSFSVTRYWWYQFWCDTIADPLLLCIRSAAAMSWICCCFVLGLLLDKPGPRYGFVHGLLQLHIRSALVLHWICLGEIVCPIATNVTMNHNELQRIGMNRNGVAICDISST